MITEEQMDHFAEVLMDLLIERPPSAEEQQEALTNRLVEALEEAGFSKFSNEDLTEALDRVSAELTTQHEQGIAGLHQGLQGDMDGLASSLQADFDADLEAGLTSLSAQQIAPLREHIANMPNPVNNYVTHEHITNEHITNEGDQIVDQSIRVEAGDDADVRIDSQNRAVQADDSGIAVGGGVEDSAVNSGQVDGVMTGSGDVSEVVVGDNNLTVTDSEIDAMAVGGGDAVSMEDIDGNANIGGMQVGIDAEGDVNAAIGSANDLAQDQSVTFDEGASAEMDAMEESFAADAAAAEFAEIEADIE